MENSSLILLKWARVTIATGVLALIAYFFSVVFKFLPTDISRLLFFSIGPLSIISVVGFYKVIKSHKDSISLLLGALFQIIAGVILNMMAVVQATQFTTLGKQINAATDESKKEVLTEILWGVNVVQAGLDISWDIFISIGTILLGIALLDHPKFGRVIGVLGILVASSALILNLVSFPTAPSEAGLIDLGPGVGIWYGIVILLLWKSLPSFKSSL